MPAPNRSLVFTIPGSPPLKVVATENNGKIDFVIDVQDTTQLTGDLRGFFFDIVESKMAGMRVTGDALVTKSQVGANAVLDLGNGATMAAKTAAKFDIGLEIGTVGRVANDVTGAVSFTLSNGANNLTLDDIAGQRFGAKIDSVGAVGTARAGTTTLMANASAAPDAKNDVFTIKEDGAGSGANTLAQMGNGATKAVTLNVLANDTDADRDVLKVVDIDMSPRNGTVSIAADGRTLLYTPNQNWSGTETIVYGISDGKGGTDYATATVNVTAVADAPLITFSTRAGSAINETIVTVTARTTDTDGSEVISAIVPATLAAGLTLTAQGGLVKAAADTWTQTYVLSTVKTQSVHENLYFTATARETSNGVTASTEGATRFDYDFKSATNAVQFTATDRSMWSEGSAFKIDYDKFLGIDLGSFNERVSAGVDFGVVSGEIFAGVEVGFKAGLDVKLHITGGEVDATADYEITVDSAFNRTTDVLQIDTAGLLKNLSLLSESPNGSLYLAAIAKAVARVYAGFEVSVGVGELSEDFGDTFTIFGLNYNEKFVLVNANSEGAQTNVQLPEPLDFLNIDFAWPTIRTENSTGSTTLTNSGESENFLQANLDIDELIIKVIDAVVFGGTGNTPNFLSVDESFGPIDVEAVLYDASLFVGANFKQKLITELQSIKAIMHLEDGSTRAFTLGDTLTFLNASSLDRNGNGVVDFTIDFDLEATLSNDIELGFNAGYHHEIGKLGLYVDIGVTDFGDSFGPLVDQTFDLSLGGIDIYSDTFKLDFQSMMLKYFV